MAKLFGRPQRTSRRGAVEQAIGALENVRRRFGRTTSAKSEGGAYGKAVGLGISALVALIIISFSVWLFQKRTREETASLTPEPEEDVEEAVLSEEETVARPGPPNAEEVPPREDPPPGEERPERRGETPTSPPIPREEPPPGEERPGRR
jgi:hypothetical protein